ncbi:MAG: glycosyltransferase [Methanosarcinaceae archaeon]|nr:glycosyltransferase [Methanosarcinaceae archaeon]
MRKNANRPHTLFIAPQPFYEDRGTPIAICQELEVLSEFGFDVDVATYPMGSDICLSGVNLVRSANPLWFRSVQVGISFKKILLDVCLLKTVIRLARQTPYDCVHGVEEGALMAFACKTLFGMPVIYDMHSSLPEQLRKTWGLKMGPGRWLALRIERWMVKGADALLTSPGLSSLVMSIARDKRTWECCFNVCDPSQQNDALARRLGVLQRPTVVYAGNFSQYQGLELLIESAALVHAKMPDVVFVLVGGTEFELSFIEKLVRRHRLSDIIQLHPRVPRHEVADYLAIADALVLPRPRGENAPLKIYEYMRSGKPIVATDIKAHTVLLSEKTAFLVKPEPTPLADGILLALQDKEHARKLALAAKSRYGSNMNKSLRDTLFEAYQWVLGSRISTPYGTS